VRVQAAGVYISAFEQITAQKFAFPDAAMPTLERIRKALLK